MAEQVSILALGGDGIGPEVLNAGLRVLDAIAPDLDLTLDINEDLLGGAAWDAHGTFIREETLATAKRADAVLVGSVGGPKWDDIKVPGGPEMQDGLMRLRKELDTYAGLRPARAHEALIGHTPFRPEIVRGADVMVLREMCGGAFFAEPRGIERHHNGDDRAFDTTLYTEGEIARIARAGFDLARRRRSMLLSVDKSNVMESGILWREVTDRIGKEEYPDIELTHFYTDNAAYQLARRPKEFDVIVGDNLFGDILSDQAGAFAGSLGILPSACLPGIPKPGERQVGGIFEPVHGSAPDIAGQGVANPCGMILTVAMMLNYALAQPDVAQRLETAVDAALLNGALSPDLGGSSTTTQVADAVIGAYRNP